MIPFSLHSLCRKLDAEMWKILLHQEQQELRQQYGLPYKPVITDPKTLQTPPSERGLPAYNTNPQ
jgi:hypothetical protein